MPPLTPLRRINNEKSPPILHSAESGGLLLLLQVAVANGSGEGNGVPDVADTGQVHDATLEAQTEARVTGGAVLAQIQIESVVLGLHAQLLDTGLQNVVVVLTLAAADDLADAGHQAVHGCHGLAVGVQLHIEGLDFLGVVCDEDGLLEDHLGEVPLVLGLQVGAPVDGVLELVIVLLQQRHGVGIGDAAEVIVQHVVQPIQQALVQELVEEGHFLGSVLQHIGNDELNHILRQTHIVLQVGEGNLRLDHPELGGVAGGVGVFRPEGGAEGVDIAEGHGEGLAVELAGHRQVGGLAVEILRVVNLAVLSLGHVVQVKGGDLEHFAGALAVRAGDQRGVDIDKIPVLEELVDGHCRQRTDAEHGLEGIGPGPQMGDGPQELHGVLLRLQGIVASGGAFNADFAGLNLKGLLGIRGHLHGALHDQGRAHVDLGDFLEICQAIVIHHLHGGEISTVVQDDKAKLLAGALIADPAADLDGLTCVFFGVLEQLTNSHQFHGRTPLFLQKYRVSIRQFGRFYKREMCFL